VFPPQQATFHTKVKLYYTQLSITPLERKESACR